MCSWNYSTADILQAIHDNPDLPVNFMVPNDELADDYGATLHQRHFVKVCEIGSYNGMIYDDPEDLEDDVRCDVWDDDLPIESEREVRTILESIAWEKCILIYTGA